MSDMKWMPGPWSIQDVTNNNANEDDIGVGDGEWWVADVCGDCGGGEVKANAQLIAAAPDLYEALLSSTEFMTGADEARANAALAKARGE